jgi:hypothetical protein
MVTSSGGCETAGVGVMELSGRDKSPFSTLEKKIYNKYFTKAF